MKKTAQPNLAKKEEYLINKNSRRRFLSLAALTTGFVILMRNTLIGSIKGSHEESKETDALPESFMDKADFGPMPYPAPDWLRNAVIIEVPTRGFNVSDYKNSGNWKSQFGDTSYKSITAKLDFLKDMGVNVLCLYSVYNCTPGTNLYALRFSEQNPDMGTLEDVRELTREAHLRGMYIISNTNHYGVHPTSPLLTEHPTWFLPASQQIAGQRVFDLNNVEARAYIVDMHAWWCTDIGLDGWRIDLGSNHFKKSVWSEIVTKCFNKGKKILLAPEGRQLVGNIEGAGRHGKITADGKWGLAATIFDMQNSYWLQGLTADNPYRCKEISGHNVGNTTKDHDSGGCAYNYNSACGREGCYRVKGSGFIYGYNSMFAPMVPWMLPGELFNATHLALPILKYNPKMLHSWLDWTDVDSQKVTVNNFRKISKIREDNRDIFHNNMYETKLINIPYSSSPSSPVNPYARYIWGKKAGIVIGNDSTTDDVTFALQIPLAAMGLDTFNELYVSDCRDNTTKKVSRSEINSYSVLVPKDKSAGGGVRVIIISAG